MQCQRCGKELSNSTRCNFCGFENSVSGNVREMSGTEKHFFNGVTIDASDEDGNFKSQNRNSDYGGGNFSRRMTYINFGNFGGGGFFSRLIEKFVRGLLNGNFLAKIVAGLILTAAFGIIFFAAVPIMFFMLALGLGIILYAKIKE